MAQSLEAWVESEVKPYASRSLAYLSQYHFFRDPTRPVFSDPELFFSPADGVVLYQETVKPDEALVNIKGVPYTPRQALRNPWLDQSCLIIGIFMTFFDVHVNRVPYAGRLCWRMLDPVDTLNYPMLDIEKDLLEELRVDPARASYLHHNQRMVNRVDVPSLKQSYYVLQIADYDVDSITPFDLGQNQQVCQGKRFSQIRYGSQVDLVIPLSGHVDFVPLQTPGTHVEAGVDPLVRVVFPN
ncbi:phosphatidylserine decarboxylase [Allokutzneria sp. A3M-2-11 16]|uniref:phosphatidylserine decarboxylase n=1 Tax=Allokutzneria sp. A3M-2-11 16 TaxID=2962043 RepID=UPI0020B83AE1|nr:phosphatidylserine decarboxylase [Allokutzneria sp. A3M-2-11 16]MCP3802034.1 phosphatidylserine decarboxylase [Allokutzneria sp. A3M-2-11 16]